MRFDEQVAVITGAGAGLGRAYAIALAERGAHVVLIDAGIADPDAVLDQDSGLAKTAQTLSELGAQTMSFKLDVRDSAGLNDAVTAILGRWGHIDIVINNASIHHPCAFEELSYAQWQQQLDIDVNGSFILTKLVWPQMKRQGYGRILMSCGASALYGDRHESCFSTSKMALIGLVNSLAIEGVDSNICVNSITPHALTQMTEHHLSPLVKPLFSTSSVNAVMLFLTSSLAPSGQHLLVAAGSVSHGKFTESPHMRITDAECNPNVIHARWHELKYARPYRVHRSGEAQITAWAKRSASEHHIVIE